MGLEALVPLAIQGGTAVAFIIMWWFERQDKLHERGKRDAERDEYIAELKERDKRLTELAERGLNNAHATTVALTTIKDLVIHRGGGPP